MENCCLAVVDMGTNSFHMIIAKINADGSIKIIDREKKLIRLGSHEGIELSYISPEETDLSIKVLSQFKKLSDSYGAKFKAIATSAVREAKNKSQFTGKIERETGINIEVIDGKKEAWYIYLGARKALSLYNKNVLCIDIGGGSTEFINVNNGEIIFAESIKVGAVRLSKLFFPDYILTKERIIKCSQHIEKMLSEKLKNYSHNNFDVFVGSSGTIEAIASIVLKQKGKKVPKSLNSVCFEKDELKEISELILSADSIKARLKIKGMEEKRADIIPAGLLILNKAFQLFKIKEIRISEYALREGIVFDLLQKHNASLDSGILTS